VPTLLFVVLDLFEFISKTVVQIASNNSLSIGLVEVHIYAKDISTIKEIIIILKNFKLEDSQSPQAFLHRN
jgi:hypothetical protein